MYFFYTLVVIIMKEIEKFFKDNKIVLVSLFAIFIVTYGFAGTNSIINIDGINDYVILNKLSDYKLYLSVGRWAWAIIGYIFNYYPVPFLALIMNGILFSIGGALLGKIFNIKREVYVILVSTIMMAFPTNVIAYTYLPWQFSIGIGYLLSIVSVYILKYSNNKFKLLLSSLLIGFCTSIYQSFLPLIMVLCIGCLIINFDNSKKLYKEFLKYIVYGFMGVVVYIVGVKLSTLLFNVEMNSYQNADQMFSINYNISLIKKNLSTLLDTSFGVMFPENIHLMLKIVMFFGVLVSLFKYNVKNMFLYLVLVVLLLISPKIFCFIKPYQFYHIITLMAYSMFYVVGVTLLLNNFNVIRNNKFRKYFSNFMIVILVIIIFGMIVSANKSFVMARQSTEASFQYLNRLQMRIEELDGYSDLEYPKKYYLYRDDPNKTFFLNKFSNKTFLEEQGVNWTFLSFNGDTIVAFNLLGVDVVEAKVSEEDEKEILKLLKDAKEYPDKSGIFIYKDIVVIKMEL